MAENGLQFVNIDERVGTVLFFLQLSLSLFLVCNVLVSVNRSKLVFKARLLLAVLGGELALLLIFGHQMSAGERLLHANHVDLSELSTDCRQSARVCVRRVVEGRAQRFD